MSSLVITKADARICRAKLKQPFCTARGQHDVLENVLFSIQLTDGVRGFGEAAVATHITGETVQETLKNLKYAAKEIQGRSCSEYGTISQAYQEKFGKNPCALAALEMALLDVWTRKQGIPLWKFFGNRLRTLKTDMTIVLGDAEEAEQAARKILCQGICSIKVKIGRNFTVDLKRVAAVAKCAKRCPIYLDANQGFTAAQTLKFLKELAQLKIRPALVEQPVPKEDWEGLKKVTQESKILVCADESVASLADAKRLIKEKAAGAINIKFMKTGILEACEIVKLAKRNHIKLMIGGMMESPLATTAAAHFAAGLGGFDFIDLDGPFFLDQVMTRGLYVNRAGVYDLRKVKAGIGVAPFHTPDVWNRSHIRCVKSSLAI